MLQIVASLTIIIDYAS